jgi:putative membrane protein
MMNSKLPLAALLTVALGACTGTGSMSTGARTGTDGSQPSGILGTGPAALNDDTAVTTDADGNPVNRGSDMTRTSGNEAAGASATGDGFVLGMVSAVNEHEIAASRQARGKNVTGQVLAYAQQMEQEHSANQAKGASLGRPEPSSQMQALKSKKASERQALDQKTGKDYEAAYMAAMVKDHREALAMIDSQLLPKASSAAVREHLTMTRRSVAMHLEHAERLVADMR